MITLRKIDTEKIGIIAGVMGFLISFVFILLAYINSPDYDPVNQTISKLGILTISGSYFFATGTILSGMAIIILFWLYITKNIPVNSLKLYNTDFSTLSGIFGVLGGIFLIGVGIFPDKGFTVIPHFITAALMFSCMGTNIFLNSVILIENNLWDNSGTNLGYFGIAVVLIAIIHAIFSLLKFFGPVWQKIAVFSFIVWYILFFIYLLVRKKI